MNIFELDYWKGFFVDVIYSCVNPCQFVVFVEKIKLSTVDQFYNFSLLTYDLMKVLCQAERIFVEIYLKYILKAIIYKDIYTFKNINTAEFNNTLLLKLLGVTGNTFRWMRMIVF